MREFVTRMDGKIRRFLASRDKKTYIDKFLRNARWKSIRSLFAASLPLTYAERLSAERDRYRDVVDVNALPDIFHYWSEKHLRPLFSEFQISQLDDWFASHFLECASRTGSGHSTFVSVGSGNCDTEIRVAKLMKQAGLERFTIECIDINESMLDRGEQLARREGVSELLSFVQSDFNDWRSERSYDGIMANQSLHHVVNLEGLFEVIGASLHPSGYFVVSDIIGRNGHQRWPEAMHALRTFWEELPPAYRFNQLLKRHEEIYENWDCSAEGFEGIRAQDILPLLFQRFQFYKFIAFGNIIDPLIDRAFGHNFDPQVAWDRNFIDRVHAYDEAALASGSLKPTHMFAVMTLSEPPSRQYSRGLSPEFSMRDTIQR